MASKVPGMSGSWPTKLEDLALRTITEGNF
jgi:hypothetical protein